MRRYNRCVLNKANFSGSLRVTVPTRLLDEQDLKEKDAVDWSIEEIRGEKVLVVRKAQMLGATV
jgi:hypothetical protein